MSICWSTQDAKLWHPYLTAKILFYFDTKYTPPFVEFFRSNLLYAKSQQIIFAPKGEQKGSYLGILFLKNSRFRTFSVYSILQLPDYTERLPRKDINKPSDYSPQIGFNRKYLVGSVYGFIGSNTKHRKCLYNCSSLKNNVAVFPEGHTLETSWGYHFEWIWKSRNSVGKSRSICWKNCSQTQSFGRFRKRLSQKIFQKLGVENITEAIAMATHLRLI